MPESGTRRSLALTAQVRGITVDGAQRVSAILASAGHVPTSTVAGVQTDTAQIAYRKSGFAVTPYRGTTVKVAYRVAGRARDEKINPQLHAYAQTLRDAGLGAMVKRDPKTEALYLLVIVPGAEDESADAQDGASADRERSIEERPMPEQSDYDPAYVLRCRRAVIEIQAESFHNNYKRAYARAVVAWLYGERHIEPQWTEYFLKDEVGDVINRKLADLFMAPAMQIVRHFREIGAEQ